MPQPISTPDEKSNALVRLPRKPHRLVAAWIEEDRRNRAAARQYGWPTEPYDIKKRVFCVCDTLFKAAEKRGHTVTHERLALRPAWLVVGSERIEVQVRERIRHQRIRLSEEELKDPTNVALNRRWKQTREPAGTLLLEASAAYRRLGKRRWEDTGATPLEDRVDEILTEIERLAEEAVALRQADEERERRWEEERERKLRRAALIERADRRRDLTRKAASDWREATALRGFVDAVAAHLKDHPSHRVAAWLKWAHARADGMDPLSASKEELVSMLMTPAWKKERADEDLD